MLPTATFETASRIPPADRRLGFWSAVSLFLLGVAYLAVGLAWLAWRRGGGSALEPTEPFLTVLEVLVLLSAPAFVVLMAAVHAWAPAERKVSSLAALALTAVFAALTAANHFVRLTAGRQGGSGGAAGFLFSPRWPSPSLAVDFLAWGPFLGLSFLFAAAAFRGGRLRAAIRASLVASGSCNLASVLGPVLGDLRLSLLGVAGWMCAVVACALLAILFGRPAASARRLLAGAGMGAWADETVRRRG